MIMETIEEKARAYNKALEKVRYLYKHLNNEGTVIYPFELENIFPELKESEDEKIRKAIHIYLGWLDGRKDYAPKGQYTIMDMIAWLEKQGEQKSADIPIDFEQYVENLLNLADGEGHGSPPKTKKVAAELLQLAYKQKPTEDIDAEKASEEYRNYRMSCGITDPVMLDEIESAYYEGAIRKKPTSWSEEDEEELNKIIAHFDWTGNNRFTKDDCEWAQYWLKSLKYRVQPKQEWSEEDEKAIKDLIDIVEAYYSLRIYKTREKELLDWLKSLRPQNHWKPSDEQMEVLQKYAEQNNSDGYVLTSLYNNLKELKN